MLTKDQARKQFVEILEDLIKEGNTITHMHNGATFFSVDFKKHWYSMPERLVVDFSRKITKCCSFEELVVGYGGGTNKQTREKTMLTKEEAVKQADREILDFLRCYPHGSVRKLKVTEESVSYDYCISSLNWSTITIKFQPEFKSGDLLAIKDNFSYYAKLRVFIRYDPEGGFYVAEYPPIDGRTLQHCEIENAVLVCKKEDRRDLCVKE